MKPEKSDKVLKAVVITFLVLIILIPLIWIGLAFGAIGQETDPKSLENNPYINAKYENWDPVEISSWGSVLFPKDWNVKQGEMTLQITDNDGNVILRGLIDATANIIDLNADSLTWLLGEEVISFDAVDVWDVGETKECTLAYLTINDDSEKDYYCLRIGENTAPGLYLAFVDDLNLDFDGIVDLSQAIYYSPTFLDACKTGDDSVASLPSPICCAAKACKTGI